MILGVSASPPSAARESSMTVVSSRRRSFIGQDTPGRCGRVDPDPFLFADVAVSSVRPCALCSSVPLPLLKTPSIRVTWHASHCGLSQPQSSSSPIYPCGCLQCTPLRAPLPLLPRPLPGARTAQRSRRPYLRVSWQERMGTLAPLCSAIAHSRPSLSCGAHLLCEGHASPILLRAVLPGLGAVDRWSLVGNDYESGTQARSQARQRRGRVHCNAKPRPRAHEFAPG
ncbi:hypothetical protein DFH06DRAFT_461249 [Mycena polygramma]|nr:hypothetical protein DFH06DRAFT_461249 [Mycena polygramma]